MLSYVPEKGAPMNSTTTELGKMLRKLRIDREETLGDMAEQLGYTSSYLSAIEKGKRPAPSGFASKLSSLYSLSAEAERGLAEAADKTVRNVKVDLSVTSDVKREAALVFARSFDELDDETSMQILKLIQAKRRDG